MNSTRADLRLSSEQGRVGRSEGLGLPWKACERLGASACPLTALPTRWPWFELGAFAGTRACMLACPQADLAGEDRHVGWRIEGRAPRTSSPSRSAWSRSPRRSLPGAGTAATADEGPDRPGYVAGLGRETEQLLEEQNRAADEFHRWNRRADASIGVLTLLAIALFSPA